MTISLLWLNDYLKTELTPEQLADALTSIGLEVEKMEVHESIKGGLKDIIAGKVLTCVKHPDADRLSVTTVDVGKEKIYSIVCGGPNVAAGQTVWVALPGTTLYDKEGKPWTIKDSKIRGAISEGMICAEDELGLGESHDGVMVLPDDVKIGTKASDYYHVTSDTIFEIGLTPNRSDATSIIGVAEDLAAYLTIQNNKTYKVQWPEISDIRSDNTSSSFKVSVRNREACPRYSGIIISEIKIGPSPDWIQKRLQSIGVKSINNVIDITNFVLHEMGQPLHAFDADKIKGKEIIVEAKKAGTPFLALDGQTYTLSDEDLMICDGDGHPMCIGGVYGGLNSGVTNETKSIFVEAAHFNAGWVRRSSMRHNLRTEAARRFEKGSDPNITTKAIARAADLITSLAGGKIASQLFDIYPNPISPAKISLSIEKINAVTGVSFTMPQVERILQALNMQIIESSPEKLVVTVPTNKADVLRDIDVIEEILRIYGFTNVPLPARMHTSVAIESRYAPHRMRRLIGQFLASRGFLEAMNMSLTQPSYYKGLDVVDPSTPFAHALSSVQGTQWVTIHNTSNESQNLMRPEMIVPTLETLKRNVNRKQEDIRLFEFGNSYMQADGQPIEKEHLVITLSGEQNPDHWLNGSAKPIDFFSLKAEVNALLGRLGIKEFQTQSLENKNGFEYGLELKSGNSFLVRYGRVSNTWVDRFDIRQPVFIADFNFKEIVRHASQSITLYEEVNRFPSVERDLAIVIDEKTSYDDISKVVIKSGGTWLTNLQVFDIYINPDQLGAGKMSMALRFTIENKEATLTDKDLEPWLGRVQKALSSELKAEIRK